MGGTGRESETILVLNMCGDMREREYSIMLAGPDMFSIVRFG